MNKSLCSRLGVLLSFMLLFTDTTLTAQATLDKSAVDVFWEVADTLATDRQPSEALWMKFAKHPAYLQIQRSGRRVTYLKKVLPLVFSPAKAERLKTVLEGKESIYQYLAIHLLEVKERRVELEQYLRTTDFDRFKKAYKKSQTYLPTDIPEDKIHLTIYLALFEDNGFGGKVITMDLLHLLKGSPEENFDFFAHEFHHSLRILSGLYQPGDSSRYDPILTALKKIPLEGVASMLDKSKYFDEQYYRNNKSIHPDQMETIREFQDLVKNAPANLSAIDSLLVSELSIEKKGRALFGELPWSGHAIGYYMSAAIEKGLGRKALIEAQYSCIDFFLQYQKVANQDSELYVFSSETMAFLNEIKEDLKK